MIIIALKILIVLSIIGFLIVMSALRNAPEGHEDEEGFHYGKKS